MSEPWHPVRVAAGEELAFGRAVMRHFHEDATEEQLARLAPLLAADDYRAWVVREGGEIVGNLGAYAMSVSVPGGGTLPAAGVTAVGVAQTHRRRGLLRTLMTAGLDEAAEREEPVALLFASESAIYPRFGFGVTAPAVGHRIDRGVAFRDPVAPGMVEPAGVAEVRAAWPGILEGLRAQRGGCVSRSPRLWELGFVDDPPDERDGASGRRLAHVPARGYVAYRVAPGHAAPVPSGEVRVQELVATDPEAEAALWQHVCDVDLTETVLAWHRPPDDPLLQLLVDPMRARTRLDPPLYARLLDVVRAFEARAYAVDERLTLRIEDVTRDQSGTYRLRLADGVGEVRRVGDGADLSMPIESAAAVWLGGVRATQLRDARRLVEHVDGAAARLDRAMWVDRQPWAPFDF